MFSDENSIPDMKQNIEAQENAFRLDAVELEWSNLEIGGVGLPNKIIKGVSGIMLTEALRISSQSG